jgi:hypothetical protein
MIAVRGKGRTISKTRGRNPVYHIVKDKVTMRQHDEEAIARSMEKKFGKPDFDRTEGVKMVWPDAWCI